VVGTQFKPFAAWRAGGIHQVADIQLAFAVFAGQLDVFLALQVLHAQLVVGLGADDIAAVPLAGDVVWPLAVMGDGGDVGRIRVAIAEGEVDDGAGVDRHVKTELPSGKRFGQPHRARVAAGAPAIEVEQEAHAVAAMLVDEGVVVAVIAGLTTMAGRVP
jgi:hypothetical protein